MTTFGLNVPRWMAKQIDARLEYGDSRSAEIRELLALSLAIEEELAQQGVTTDDLAERERAVREAIRSFYGSE